MGGLFVLIQVPACFARVHCCPPSREYHASPPEELPPAIAFKLLVGSNLTSAIGWSGGLDQVHWRGLARSSRKIPPLSSPPSLAASRTLPSEEIDRKGMYCIPA